MSIYRIILVIFSSSLIFGCGFCSAAAVNVADVIPKKTVSNEFSMHREIDWVDHNIQRYYLPQLWKKNYLKLSWSDEVKRAHSSLKSTTTDEEYAQIIKPLIFSLRDLHISCRFDVSKDAKATSIPITFFTCDDRLFVKEVYSPKISDIWANDEVIEINEEPAWSYFQNCCRKNMGEWGSKGDNLTAHSLFENRPHCSGQIVGGKLNLKLLDSKSGAAKTAELMWVDDAPPLPPFEEDQITAPIPNLGPIAEIIKSTDCKASWHSHSATEKMVGFLRIQTFNHGRNGEYLSKSLGDFEALIRKLEQNTDLLVVDLRNNFGGCSNYGNALTGCLTSSPLKMFQVSELMDHNVADYHRSMVKNYEEWLKSGIPLSLTSVSKINLANTYEKFGVAPLTRDLLLELHSYSKSLIDQWEKGDKMTQWKPHYLHLPPNEKAHYTKPIVILINNTTVSAPEYMAALLRDNRKALLFGTTTAGAGTATSSRFGKFPMSGPYMIANLWLPTELTLRADGDLFENSGICPDIVCPMTLEDFTEQGVKYSQKLNQVINDLLKKDDR